MDGFGAALGRAMLGMMLVAVVAGAIAMLALEHLVMWLWSHLQVAWL